MLPIHFAPLQGYTEDAYRRFHHQLFGGVETYYTPFLRLEHKEIRSKDLRDINPDYNIGVPLIPQIIACDGKEAEQLLSIVTQKGYERVDINMGCPFPLQTRHDRGAGLLAQPDKVREICDVVRSHPDIVFSVKMRLGIDNADDWRETLPILNDTPLKHITVHPRIATQQYKGEVNMAMFEEFMATCKHPVIYNGDIRTLDDLRTIEERYPNLAGIMIGRGLLARPSLATEYAEGKEWQRHELISKIKEMHSLMLAHYERIIPGEAQQLQKLHSFWDYLEPTASSSVTDDTSVEPLLERKQWKKIVKAGNKKNYLIAIDAIR